MKLRQLQCLCAVVDAGFNISRAATVLHATQPAISKQLKQFEEELGADLMLRQLGRPVALTELGERTVAWARRALQCTDNIRAIARETGGETDGTITLATSHAHANYLLLPAIMAFSHRFPRVRIVVLQGAPSHVADLIRDGTANIGITNVPETLPKEVLPIPFFTSPRLLVLPPGHVLLKEKVLTLEKIAAYPLIIPHSLRTKGTRIERKFQQADLQVTVAVYALDADVIKTYVASGLGIGIIPAFCYSQKDHSIRVRDVGHLFDPAESAVMLKRHSHLQKYMYQFLTALDPSLEQTRLEGLVHEHHD